MSFQPRWVDTLLSTDVKPTITGKGTTERSALSTNVSKHVLDAPSRVALESADFTPHLTKHLITLTLNINTTMPRREF